MPDRLKTTIVLGAYPGVEHDSRSGWLFSTILSLIRRGVPDETILGVITDGRWEISASILDKPDPDAEARRQIGRAHGWLTTKLEEEFPDDAEMVWPGGTEQPPDPESI